jgi:hypothetical protein
MIDSLNNAAPPRPPLFHLNIAHFKLKNFIFSSFFAFFLISHFSKTKKLPTPLDWYDITLILDKILILYQAQISPA